MNAPDAAVEVDITGLHANGYGVAHLPKLGHVYVPFAFPGQRVSVRLVEEVRSGQWQAELLQPNAAHCSISSRCGGCLWPGVAYTEQLAGKENLFRRALSGWPELASMPAEVHASPAITEYRSRMHLHANFFRGRFSFGFYARGSRDLLPVTDCTVASPALQRAVHELASLRSHPFTDAHAFGFGIELVDLAETGRVLLTLYSSAARRENLQHVIQPFSGLASRPIVQLAHENDGQYFPWQKVGAVQMYTRAGCFQQVNRAQSDRIREILGTHISETGCHTLLDLYSGSGNYSLPFAGRVTSIDGFDDNQIGIEVANFNLRQNGIANARYTCADAADALQRLLSETPARVPDLVILDPARFGIGAEVPRLLKRLRPPALALVSNRTQAFATDARRLIASGFRPVKLHLVDCFPFTPHWNVVSLWAPH